MLQYNEAHKKTKVLLLCKIIVTLSEVQRLHWKLRTLPTFLWKSLCRFKAQLFFYIFTWQHLMFKDTTEFLGLKLTDMNKDCSTEISIGNKFSASWSRTSLTASIILFDLDPCRGQYVCPNWFQWYLDQALQQNQETSFHFQELCNKTLVGVYFSPLRVNC